MRYRKLTATGDYSFGQGNQNFYINNPEAVGQAVRTRLLLLAGEWFLNILSGTAYRLILGTNTAPTRDLTIKNRILKTPGVLSLLSYASQLNPDRSFKVQARIQTIYDQSTDLEVNFP